jgi:flagellar biosynthesis GTPase FlhF
VQNELLEAENKGLRHVLNIKKKHNDKSNTLDLQQREEYHGGAVFWSPSKIREVCFRERVRPDEEEQDKLQKAERKYLREQAALLREIEQEEARVEREMKKKEQEKERERKAAERAELQRKNSKKERLQPPKKLYSHPKRVREQLHKVSSQGQSVGVVHKLLKVVLVVGILHRALHPKLIPAAANQPSKEIQIVQIDRKHLITTLLQYLVIIAIVGDNITSCLW